MRPYMQIFVLMLSILATSVSLHGQQFSQPLNSGYWTFGLNTGKAYQSSDVKSSASGYGLGLTVGKNIYYKPGATLDFGVRSRFSYNQTKGLSPIRNYNIANNTAVNGLEGLDYTSFPDKLGEDRGFIFSNHKTDLAEAGLEAVVTLNELKEKTGVKVSFFGGVGANIYNVRTDQGNRIGDEYFEEYAALNDRAPVSEINRNLRSAILDGDYETQADGFENGAKAGFMPSLGAEVGFQVTPKFSIDLGHRTTFSGTDLLDGEQWKSGDDDILHYTYMGANFNINKREKVYLAPEIIVMQPRNATATDIREIKVYAKIKNVERAADVELLLNGKAMPFNFRKEKLSATIFLQKGENDIEIIAGNFGGEDRKLINVLFEERTVVIPPPPVRPAPPVRPTPPPVVYRPSVEILNTDRTIREDRFRIEARTNNIEFREDIELFVNGRNTNFQFDQYRQKVDATIYLSPGENDIVLRVFNNAGEAEDRMIVVFDDRVPTPYVKITQPEPQFQTSRNGVKVVAETEFVFHKRDILLTVNGREVRHFDFRNDCLSKQVRLEEGRNIIRIRVENESGFSEDKVVVFHKIVQPDLREPVIQIISPADHTTVENKVIELVANVSEVNGKRNIELELNGTEVRDFTFTGETLKARLTLKKGANKVVVKATNKGGTTSKSITIIYKDKIVPPVKEVKKAETIVKSPTITKPEKVTGVGTNTKVDVKPEKSGNPVEKKSRGGF